MRTERANLPGKCLHKRHCQFKLSVGKLLQAFLFFLLLCPHIHKSEKLAVQAALEQGTFPGDTHNDRTFTIWLQLNVSCSAHLPLSADC